MPHEQRVQAFLCREGRRPGRAVRGVLDGGAGLDPADEQAAYARDPVGRARARIGLERDGGRLHDVGHRDRKRLVERLAALILCPNQDRVAAVGLEVERRVRSQLISDDREGGIVGAAFAGDQRVGERVGIDVSRGEQPDDRIDRIVFGDRRGGEPDVGRRLVGIFDRDGDRLRGGQRAVAHLHDHVVDVVGVCIGRRLAVRREDEREHAAGSDRELRRVGSAHDRVGERGAGVHVGRRHGLHDGLVLGDGHCRIGGQCRRLVDVRHADRKHLLERRVALVGYLDADRVTALPLEVECLGGLELIAGDGERIVVGAAVTGDERVGERVAGIRVGRGKEADHRADGVVFRNRRGGEGDVRRRFVDVRHGDGDRLRGGEAAIAHFDDHVVHVVGVCVGRSIEVWRDGEREHATRGDRELRRIFTAHDRVGERGIRIHVGCRRHLHGRLVLGDADFRAGGERGRLVGVGHADREDLVERRIVLVGGPNADRVAALGLEVERFGRLQFVANDRERGVVGVAFSGHERVGERVAGVGVARRERADDCVDRVVFTDRGGGERDIGRGVVEVHDRDRDGRLACVAVLHGHERKGVGLLGLVVGRCDQPDLAGRGIDGHGRGVIAQACLKAPRRCGHTNRQCRSVDHRGRGGILEHEGGGGLVAGLGSGDGFDRGRRIDLDVGVHGTGNDGRRGRERADGEHFRNERRARQIELERGGCRRSFDRSAGQVRDDRIGVDTCLGGDDDQIRNAGGCLLDLERIGGVGGHGSDRVIGGRIGDRQAQGLDDCLLRSRHGGRQRGGSGREFAAGLEHRHHERRQRIDDGGAGGGGQRAHERQVCGDVDATDRDELGREIAEVELEVAAGIGRGPGLALVADAVAIDVGEDDRSGDVAIGHDAADGVGGTVDEERDVLRRAVERRDPEDVLMHLAHPELLNGIERAENAVGVGAVFVERQTAEIGAACGRGDRGPEGRLIGVGVSDSERAARNKEARIVRDVLGERERDSGDRSGVVGADDRDTDRLRRRAIAALDGERVGDELALLESLGGREAVVDRVSPDSVFSVERE